MIADFPLKVCPVRQLNLEEKNVLVVNHQKRTLVSAYKTDKEPDSEWSTANKKNNSLLFPDFAVLKFCVVPFRTAHSL